MDVQTDMFKSSCDNKNEALAKKHHVSSISFDLYLLNMTLLKDLHYFFCLKCVFTNFIVAVRFTFWFQSGLNENIRASCHVLYCTSILLKYFQFLLLQFLYYKSNSSTI